jgi:UDPglucose--hexose-1-phosphate uridylyltransferase
VIKRGESRLTFEISAYPHRRFNPLTGEWVLVSPNRTDRPWKGLVEKPAVETQLAYDPTCYMCPGNTRATGKQNPSYDTTFVFDNDYPGLRLETAKDQIDPQGLFVARGESGTCRVIVFSPRHDLTISRMSNPELRKVVSAWIEQYEELGTRPSTGYVQLFENRGALMGASNPHPHCQIWGTSSVPSEPAKELTAQREYFAKHGTCLLCAYLDRERSQGDRVVFENDHFSVLVPYWALWPFETMVIARRHLGKVQELTASERDALADVLKRLTTRYDRLFDALFPYTMGFHQSPIDNEAHPEWHLHAHYYPPLLRSATIRKFMVGFEMLGTPQRDFTAESAAERLRKVSDV